MRMITQRQLLIITGLLLSFQFLGTTASAQFKTTEPSDYRNTGNILKVEQRQPTSNLMNFFNMKMYHSYEASFMSFGGQTANLNMYTNTMLFSFSPKFTGRLDLALAHSPFGNGLSGMSQTGAQFMVRNAELNYQLSENTFIRFSYQQVPMSTYSFFDSGFNQYNSFGQRNFSSFNR